MFSGSWDFDLIKFCTFLPLLEKIPYSLQCKFHKHSHHWTQHLMSKANSPPLIHISHCTLIIVAHCSSINLFRTNIQSHCYHYTPQCNWHRPTVTIFNTIYSNYHPQHYKVIQHWYFYLPISAAPKPMSSSAFIPFFTLSFFTDFD